jgi:hypothetical protein
MPIQTTFATQPPLAGQRGITRPPAPQSIRLGLRHYWPINDGMGTSTANGRVADMLSNTGYGACGTNILRSSWKWDGKFGPMLKHVGSPLTQIIVNNSANEFSNTWTISGWVRFTSFATIGHVVCHGNNLTDRNRDLYVLGTGIPNTAFTSPAGTFKITAAATTLVLNRLYHLVSLFDGTNLQIWINGKLDASNVFAFVPSNGAGVLTSVGSGYGGTAEGVNGNCFHVAEWTRALKPEEIKLLFQFPDLLLQRYGRGIANIPPPAPGAQFIYPTIYGGLQQPDNQHGGPLPFGQLANLDSLSHG